MKKAEKIFVEDLVKISVKNPELYFSLRSIFMNRGYVQMRRFVERIDRVASDSQSRVKNVVLNSAFDKKKNEKLVLLARRIIATVDTAVDMYMLFHLCDSIRDGNGRIESEDENNGKEE